jgi:hypothetical protein
MISILCRYSLYNIYKYDSKYINLITPNSYFESKSFNFIKNFNAHFLIYKFIYILLKLINIISKNNIIKILIVLLKFKINNIIRYLYINPIFFFLKKKYIINIKLDINLLLNNYYLYLLSNKLLNIEFLKLNIYNLKGLIQIPKKYKLYTVLKSPLSDKKARDQYYFTHSKIKTIIPHWINNKLINNYLYNIKGDFVGYYIKLD